MFCAIKSFILNGSCSYFEYFSLQIGHIFLLSLKTLSSKIKNSYIYLSVKLWVVINMLNREKRLKFYMIVKQMKFLFLKIEFTNFSEKRPICKLKYSKFE